MSLRAAALVSFLLAPLLVLPAAPLARAGEPARWAAPGAEWVEQAPDSREAGVQAVFVHRRGDEALGAIRIAVDGVAPVKDLRAFAHGKLARLVETPPAFVVLRKTIRRIAGHAAYAVEYRSPDGNRRYQDVFAAGPDGRVLVFTLEAPARSYEQECPAFLSFVGSAAATR